MSKLGFWIPRTLSRAVSTRQEDSPEPFHVQEHAENAEHEIESGLRRRPGTSPGGAVEAIPRRVYRIGRTLIHSNSSSASQTRSSSQAPDPRSNVPTNASTPRHEDTASAVAPSSQDAIELAPRVETSQAAQSNQRTIHFPDEQPALPAS